MFRSKTVFILGAGSSNEVDLPLGADLTKTIAQKLKIDFADGYSQSSGDPFIVSVFEKLASQRSYVNPNITPYLEKAWQLYEALPLASSIDNLLDAHSGEEVIELCGKLAIVRSILEAEEGSKINSVEDKRRINFDGVANTWFAGFVKALTENVNRQNVGSIFNNVSFINFNYDRCIDHYFYQALQVYYSLEPKVSAEIMESLNIFHPYGSVGALPWRPGAALESVPFGSSQGDILKISKGIKTFTEQVEENDDLKKMKSAIQEAEIIVFLGFAFHRQNLELLKPSSVSKVSRVYGTAIGISESDSVVICSEIRRLLQTPAGIHLEIELNRSKHCNELFKEYWRGITTEV